MKTKTSILTLTKAFFILLVMCCFSCSDYTERHPPNKATTPSCYEGYRTVVIDSCEYIAWKGYWGDNITHKGNCKYCAKRSLK